MGLSSNFRVKPFLGLVPLDLETSSKEVNWNRPPVSWAKLNFDGSKFVNSNSALEYVIRDEKANGLSLGAKQCGNVLVLVAETPALKEGVKGARLLGCNNCIIEGNNFCVINSLKGLWTTPSRFLHSFMTLDKILIHLVIYLLTMYLGKSIL